MSHTCPIFAPEEHCVIASWLGVKPLGPIPEGESLKVVLARFGFTKGALGDRQAVAVASIIHGTIEERLPNVVTQRCVNGCWETVTSDELRRKYPKKVALFPQHLLTVAWKDAATGKVTVCAYHVAWLPLYDVQVVTASYETAGVAGCREIALGHFGAAKDVREGARDVIEINLCWQHLAEALPRWTALRITGLLGRTDADLMAEGVWG